MPNEVIDSLDYLQIIGSKLVSISDSKGNKLKDFSIYFYITLFSKQRNFEEFSIQQEELSEMFNCSIRTIQRTIKELCDFRLLKRRGAPLKVTTKKIKNTSHLTIVHPDYAKKQSNK